MDALLSIRPEFADKILRGDKQYEFRKTRFSEPSSVDSVIMYATAPAQEIVGQFEFNDVIEGKPEALWTQFGSESGIDDRSRFMGYFRDADTGYAIDITGTTRLPTPIDPQDRFGDFQPPVSFRYVDPGFKSALTQQIGGLGSD